MKPAEGNKQKWWANSKITQMWFFCVISSSWLLFAWPPNLSWWNPDYTDGSYVTAIVSSGCLREDGAPPRIASFAYLAPRQARPTLRLRASPSSVVRADGLRLWWLKVAHIPLHLVYFLSLSWNVFPGGLHWELDCCRDISPQKGSDFCKKCRAHLMFDKNVTLCI